MTDAGLCRRLQAAMDAACASGEECGCQLTVYRHGKLVCDLCAGWTTPEKTREVTPRTLFPVFSVGKGVVTTLVHILAERGLVDYEGKVADLWPEYAANGKKETAVYELLSHRAGLYEFPADLPFFDWFDWEKAAARLAAMAPLDRIGGMHHYHGMTKVIRVGETKLLNNPEYTDLKDAKKVLDILADDNELQEVFEGEGDNEISFTIH